MKNVSLSKAKNIMACILIGCLVSILLTWLQYRPVISSTSVDDFIKQAIGLTFIYQAIFLSMLFYSIILTIGHIKNSKRNNCRMKKLETVFVVVQIITFVLSVMVVYGLCGNIIVIAASIIFVCSGAMEVYRKKYDLAVSFIVWGIAVYVLQSFCTNQTILDSRWVMF